MQIVQILASLYSSIAEQAGLVFSRGAYKRSRFSHGITHLELSKDCLCKGYLFHMCRSIFQPTLEHT